MDQAELRRQLREQLDETQRELARLTTLRKHKQYEWAEEEARLKAKVTWPGWPKARTFSIRRRSC
jgi:hypothetical protein